MQSYIIFPPNELSELEFVLVLGKMTTSNNFKRHTFDKIVSIVDQ